jgi:hypothetical protein
MVAWRSLNALGQLHTPALAMSLAYLISAIVDEMMIVSTAFEEERVKAQYCAVPRGQWISVYCWSGTVAARLVLVLLCGIGSSCVDRRNLEEVEALRQ